MVVQSSLGSSGWSPSPRDRQPWLQIDLLRKYRLVAIATQGTFNSYDWVTKYTLLYGDRPDSWTPYIMKGGNSTMPGNWNYYQVKRNVFHYSFTAKHVRLLPLAWNTENGGKIGVRLELFGCPYDSYVLQYNGDDSVVYMYPGRKSRTLSDHITLNFKTLEQDGLLLHSEGVQGDIFTLELKKGRLYLHISLGSSIVHNLNGRLCELHCGRSHCHGLLQWRLHSPRSRQAVVCWWSIEPNMPHLPSTPNFRGCLENVFINEVNIIDKAKREETDIRIPRKAKKMHFTCRDILLKPMTFAGPNNYLQVPGFFRRPKMFVKFKFRSWDYTGLLMFTRFADDLGALELGLSEGQINVTIFQPAKKKIQFAAGYRLNDGYWHTVDLAARDNLLTLTIDEEEASPLRITNPFTIRTGDRYFFGGQMHSIMGRLYCLCENTGYKGEVCHMSVYKESCEAYRLSGKYWSGNYTIDPDLSGPLKPFEVYCKMKSYKAWTVIMHDRVDGTKVSGTTIERPYIGDVNYWNASWDEVSALANTSIYCEQWIDYSCYKSRLLNTAGGRPFGYWIGRNNESHYYWGGTFREIQKCGCAINQTCIDPKFQCNCDADYRQWYSDKGYLDFRDHLPVRRVVVGTQTELAPRRSSQLDHSVVMETETSGTPSRSPSRPTSPSPRLNRVECGHLFSLQNVSTQLCVSGKFRRPSSNFIRVELNTTHNLLFIFMVGDGILNVTHKSPVPLADNEWHFVQAELNVKVARIKVDWQPWTVRRFPGQTFVTMNFTLPLLVGAANKTHRPFLGCIRRNCSGQCVNATIPCRNAGQCIEGYASYWCDCNNTAYDGFYCHKDIGAYFEVGSWLKYNILKKPITDEAAWANWIDPHYDNFSLGYNDTADDIEFSFSTVHTPAVLLYISSFVQDYIAVILKMDGSVDLRYKLGLITHKYELTRRNLADGFPHYINITRHNRTIKTQVDYMEPIVEKIILVEDARFDSPKSMFLGRVMEVGDIDYEIQKHNAPGFIGCISGVRYNVYAPLKAYFRPNVTDPPVTTQGIVTESICGAFPPVLGYVPWEVDPWFTTIEYIYIHDDLGLFWIIVIAILAFLLLLAGLYSIYVYAYQQKGSYHTNEPKNLESPSSSRPLTETLRRDIKKSLPEIEEEFRTG
ncbi:hypothetical protein WMY93_003904 [Mugilogobius chulae]|uniref:Contactin associated protein 1 n=1 Tax=Mugilogobius chulae TaxID=88201 RepID=A0AAW0PXI7_9GOBI